MDLFKISDGRAAFRQWDTGRQLIVADPVCGEVHFCNGTSDCSLRGEIIEQDGKRVTHVPDILLQTALRISVFAYVKDSNGGYTQRAVSFEVLPRTKPDDYIYTEPEKQTWEKLEKRIEALENGGTGAVDPEDIQQAVEDYLTEHPDAVSSLPEITEEAEGKYLRVKNGVAIWGDLEIPQQYGLVTYDQTKTITIT